MFILYYTDDIGFLNYIFVKQFIPPRGSSFWDFLAPLKEYIGSDVFENTKAEEFKCLDSVFCVVHQASFINEDSLQNPETYCTEISKKSMHDDLTNKSKMRNCILVLILHNSSPKENIFILYNSNKFLKLK
ncbi:uncharacterized protein LOC107884779 [Acyrthosiphon pisum]|uniref:Uncharacterized protein n=1 Tax=Acyrthosiphon pisum TaxID=7029 RepID=A0A8R2NQE5_ACYPI|nr:uncharacterized protein LOC107884779 [Acyrthosiphon pisum]